MLSTKHLLFIVALATSLNLSAAAQQWKSVDDPALPKAERMRLSDYEVSIYRDGTWKQLEVTGALVSDFRPGEYDLDTLGSNRTLMGFCMFTDEFRTAARIRVKRQGTPFSQVAIRPTDYKIGYKRIDGNTIEFSLKDPGKKVSVEFDNDRDHNLFLIPDRPESKVSGENVIYYGPGEHDAGVIELHSGQTLFVDQGAVVYALIRADKADDIRIMGRGIICSSKASHNLDNRQSALVFNRCRNVVIEGLTCKVPCLSYPKIL